MSRTRTADFDLICISHLRWDFVWQRPQQLMSRFARNRRVFFIEEPEPAEGSASFDLRTGEEGVIVAVPRLPRDLTSGEAAAQQMGLLERLLADQDVRDYVLWTYTPMAVPFTRGLRPKPLATVYDCMDELSAFAQAPPALQALEDELFGNVDLVFTGGTSLFEAKRERHPDVHLFPSSVDTAHFAAARTPSADPDEQLCLPHPRLGYMGVVDERMDLALLDDIALAEPTWQLILVGPLAKIDPADLPRRPNIHYLGPRPYAELPAYLRGWDVALLPFASNEATRFISPTKTPEYLAAGLPVVSTPIVDVVRPYGEDGLVRIASGAPEFVTSCREALLEDATHRLRRVDAFLTESSWDYTAADMGEHVERVVRRNDSARGSRTQRVASGVRYDYLIVGAGFAGSVVAERLASSGSSVLVVDRRPHIGGNAFDHYDEEGILVHRYGPHIFHTNSQEVFSYLSRFTSWRAYEHRVLASVNGQLLPFPINLDTVNSLYDLKLSSSELEQFLASVAESPRALRTSEDVVVSKVGRELYNTFFRNYTRKMWGLDASQLDASVAARVPARTSQDDRYFTDTYQAMPLHGYTSMFERLLAHPGIEVLLNADFREVGGLVPYDRLVYTGPIDEFFDYRYGRLPYRSLEFRFETRAEERALPVAVVNFPNEHEYTRVTEFKHLTGQEHPKTTLVYEYPRADGDPYYPVPRPENGVLYQRYRELADGTPDVSFVGRLATYKYYNMDQVVAQALTLARRLSTRDEERTARAANGAARQRTRLTRSDAVESPHR